MMPNLDTQLACTAHRTLVQMSPAGKIAVAITLIQEVAADVPSKPIPAILADMSKILLAEQPSVSPVPGRQAERDLDKTSPQA